MAHAEELLAPMITRDGRRLLRALLDRVWSLRLAARGERAGLLDHRNSLRPPVPVMPPNSTAMQLSRNLAWSRWQAHCAREMHPPAPGKPRLFCDLGVLCWLALVVTGPAVCV